MSQFKLIYFSIPGRAQLIRTIFAIADQKFEDVRIQFNEWPEKQNG